MLQALRLGIDHLQWLIKMSEDEMNSSREAVFRRGEK